MIKEGTMKVYHGIDAMTSVLGKEKGGYAREVGSRQASDERILLLQSQLDNERRGRQEKELLIQNLSNKMSQTEGMVTKLKNQLAAQGGSCSQCQLLASPFSEAGVLHVNRTSLGHCVSRRDSSCISEWVNLYGARATGAAPGTKSI
ncbi:hypothetical protein Tco_1581412 [Tanacetum coccineum]